MAEPVEPPDPNVATVVMLAIQAAGPMVGPVAPWKAKVNAILPEVALMMAPDSAQARRAKSLLGAKFVVGDPNPVYLGYTFEESSTRLLVSFKTKVHPRWNKEGVDTMRTQRTDSQLGKQQRAQLDKIAEGTECLVWKVDEDKGDDTTVRILAHVVPLDNKVTSGPSPRSGAAESEVRPPAAAPSEGGRPAPSSGTTTFAEQVNEAMADLTNVQKVFVMKSANKAGLLPASDETIDKIIILISEVREGGS